MEDNEKSKKINLNDKYSLLALVVVPILVAIISGIFAYITELAKEEHKADVKGVVSDAKKKDDYKEGIHLVDDQDIVDAKDNHGNITINMNTPIDEFCVEVKQDVTYKLDVLEKRIPSLSFHSKKDRDFAYLIDNLKKINKYDCVEINTNKIQIIELLKNANQYIEK